MGKKHVRFPREIYDRGLVEFMNAAHFKLYGVLDLMKNKNTWIATVKISTIMKFTQLSKSAILGRCKNDRGALRDLVEWGLIKIESGKGRGRSSKYKIIKDPNIKEPRKAQKEKDQTRSKRTKRERDEKSGRFVIRIRLNKSKCFKKESMK